MNRINNLYLALAVATVGMVIALSTTTYAYMYRETQSKSNQFEPALVTCQVEETVSNSVKTQIAIKNTGNIDAYIRVRLVSYWVDEEGNIAAKASITPKINTLDQTKWIADEDNHTYYYKNKVAKETETSNLLSEMSVTLKSEDGYRQVVEVLAEAIQAEPEKAVEESWNVEVESEIITQVK